MFVLNEPLTSLHSAYNTVEVADEHHHAINFYDIVDKDEDYDHRHSTQIFVGSLLESLPFRIGILIAIFLNSVVIGLQTDKHLVSENYVCAQEFNYLKVVWCRKHAMELSFWLWTSSFTHYLLWRYY